MHVMHIRQYFLIPLDPPPYRNRYDALPCEVRGVGNGRGDMLGLERRILVKNTLRRFAVRQIVENHRNGDTRTPEHTAPCMT